LLAALFSKTVHLQHFLTGRKYSTLPFVRLYVNQKTRQIGGRFIENVPRLSSENVIKGDYLALPILQRRGRERV